MTYIQVLGKTRKEKGDSLEKLMEKVLDSVGYEDFQLGAHKTGRQIDLYAKHKVTRHPIICECKAHGRSIGSGDVNKFYGIYDKEYRHNNKLVGLFFSLSGFGSTALAAHEEMEQEVKSRFLLRDGDFILSMLRKAKFVASDDTLDFIIASRIKYRLGERYLTCTEGNIYWVQLILTDDKATHYIILGPKGEDVPAYLCSEIGSIDPRLRNLNLLNIHAMRETLLSLLDASSKTVDEIATSANECRETATLSLKNLIRDSIVEETNGKYHLRKELTTFVDLAKQFLRSEDEAKFFLSLYTDRMLNPSLIDY